jgi:hypothetical protein
MCCATPTLPNLVISQPLELIVDIIEGWSKPTAVARPTLVAPTVRRPLGEFPLMHRIRRVKPYQK